LGSVKGRTNQILNHDNVAKTPIQNKAKMIWGLLRAEPIKTKPRNRKLKIPKGKVKIF
jgi:hypothetical protein